MIRVRLVGGWGCCDKSEAGVMEVRVGLMWWAGLV